MSTFLVFLMSLKGVNINSNSDNNICCSFTILPNEIKSLKKDEIIKNGNGNKEVNDFYAKIKIGKKNEINRTVVENKLDDKIKKCLSNTIDGIYFLLDRTSDNKYDIIYMYTNIDNYNNCTNSIVSCHKNITRIRYVNEYNNKTNSSKGYMFFNGEMFRFFPQHLTKILPKYFTKQSNKKEFLEKLFYNKYKNGFKISSLSRDKTFFKYYKILLNTFYISNNYFRKINTHQNYPITHFKCNSKNINDCQAAQFIINQLTNYHNDIEDDIDHKDTDDDDNVTKDNDNHKIELKIMKLKKAFLHLQNGHKLFDETEENENLTNYFNEKLNKSCNKNSNKNNKCPIIKRYINISNNGNNFKDLIESIHTYLLHPLNSIRSTRRDLNDVILDNKFSLNTNKEYENDSKSITVNNKENNNNKSKILLINLGSDYNIWINPREDIPFKTLKNECLNKNNLHNYQCITSKIYNDIYDKCLVIYKLQSNDEFEFIFSINELISLKMYTDLTDYQRVFRRVFWINKINSKKRKYYFQWALTIGKSFSYGSMPIFDILYHGLNNTFTSNNINNIIFNGPISTTLSSTQASNFSKGKGIIWKIRSQMDMIFSVIYGIKLNKIGISRFADEQEVLLFNTKLPIIKTTVHDFDDYEAQHNDINEDIDKNKLLYLFDYIRNVSHPIHNYKKFFKTIGY